MSGSRVTQGAQEQQAVVQMQPEAGTLDVRGGGDGQAPEDNQGTSEVRTIEGSGRRGGGGRVRVVKRGLNLNRTGHTPVSCVHVIFFAGHDLRALVISPCCSHADSTHRTEPLSFFTRWYFIP